jgi:phage terminase small subunit
MTQDKKKKVKKKTRKPKQKDLTQDDLTAKQQLFILEYLRDFNATQAAIRAGYSKASATTTGNDLLRHPIISVYIKEHFEKRKEKAATTAERVLEELNKVAFSDLRDFASWDAGGIYMRPSEYAFNTGAIESIKETKGEGGTAIGIKMHNKMKALELIAKHIGMFDEQEPPKRNRESHYDRISGMLSRLAGAVEDRE